MTKAERKLTRNAIRKQYGNKNHAMRNVWHNLVDYNPLKSYNATKKSRVK